MIYILLAYLIGGYIAMALVGHYEAGHYSEMELIGWGLMWPLWAPLCLILFAIDVIREIAAQAGGGK